MSEKRLLSIGVGDGVGWWTKRRYSLLNVFTGLLHEECGMYGMAGAYEEKVM